MGTISRRDFIKGSASTAAVLGSAAIAASATTAVAAGADGFDYEADIVAVGGGGAGLMACAVAAAQGASTLVLEKAAMNGGDSILGYCPLGYWPAKKAEEGWGEETAEGYLEDYKATHDKFSRRGRAGEPMLDETPFLDKSLEIFPEACEFLRGIGVVFNSPYDSSECPEINYPREAGDPVPCSVLPSGRSWIVESPWTITLEENLATYDNATLLTSCEVTSIVMDEAGRAVGVTFIDPDGDLRRAKANKGVIITTGSFCGNSGMMEQYLGPQWAGLRPAGTNCQTGDGVRMAQQVGAALVDMGLGCVTFAGIEGALNSLALGSHTKAYGPFPGAPAKNMPSILVNRAGKRYIAETQGLPDMGPITAEQDCGFGYLICDSASDTEWLEGLPVVHWADDIETLAKAIVVDPEALVAEVERYNSFVDSGVDEDFGKHMEETYRLENAPFFAVKIEPRPVVNIGGIKTDVDGRVLNRDDQPIEGLYAAGICTGCYWEQEGFVYTGGVNQAMAWGYQSALTALDDNR